MIIFATFLQYNSKEIFQIVLQNLWLECVLELRYLINTILGQNIQILSQLHGVIHIWTYIFIRSRRKTAMFLS